MSGSGDPVTATGITIRSGSVDDRGHVMRLLDESVAWLVERGRTGQWGTEPWSTNPQRVARIGGMLRDNRLAVAERDGDVLGVIVTGPANPPYVSPAAEPQRYIHLLVSSPRARGAGIGSTLLDHARSETRAAGIRLLRVDSWGGGDRRLVEYYVSQGFTPTEGFRRDDWVGQVYEQYLD